MKKAARIFLYISLVFSIISFVVMMIVALTVNLDVVKESLGASASSYTEAQLQELLTTTRIVCWVISIYYLVPVVLDIVSLWRLKVSKSRTEYIVWGIIDLIFCGLIPGILILCIPQSEIGNQVSNQKNNANNVYVNPSNENSEDKK